MQLNIHINVPILSAMLLFLFAGIGLYHYPPQVQHTPMHSNAAHEDILFVAQETFIIALHDELVTIAKDATPINTISDYPLMLPDIIQRLQTAGKHIEQLQKATACEGTGPWKVEDHVLASKQQREVSLCELVGRLGASIDRMITFEELKICWVETGYAVLTADGKGIMLAQPSNDGYHGDKQRHIGGDQALVRMELGHCKEILESREEFIRDTGDLGEEKFLRSQVEGGVETVNATSHGWLGEGV